MSHEESKSDQTAPARLRAGRSKANRAVLDLGTLFAPRTDYSKLVGPKIDVSKLVGPKIDVSKLVGPKIDVSKLVGPNIDISKLVGPKIDYSKLVGPNIDYSKLVGPKIDYSKLVGPKIDVSRVVGAAVLQSNILRGLQIAGAVPTSSVIPDVHVSALAGDMTIGDLLGDQIDVPAELGSEMLVTDLLGDRLEAAALLGEEIDAHDFAGATTDAIDAQESKLVAALVARVDELEHELAGRLENIEAGQGWRRQVLIMLLGAFVSLVVTIAVVQIAPTLLNPDGGGRGAAQPSTASAKQEPGQASRQPRHGARRPLSQTVEKINMFLQNRLATRRLAEVRAVEAARWLDAAGLLPDSPSRPGAPLRRLLRAGVIAGGQQRPDRPHGRWFVGAV